MKRSAKPTVEDVQTWDREELLRWIQSHQPIPLDGEDLLIFTKNRIPGAVFVSQDAKFYEDCGIVKGVAAMLQILAESLRLNGRNIQQNITERRGPWSIFDRRNNFIGNKNIAW